MGKKRRKAIHIGSRKRPKAIACYHLLCCILHQNDPSAQGLIDELKLDESQILSGMKLKPSDLDAAAQHALSRLG